MKTKVVCITILVLTVLIFLGNHSATVCDAQNKTDCRDCNCSISVGLPTATRYDTLVGPGLGRHRTEKEWKEFENPKPNNKESCSVIFRNKGGKLVTENLVLGENDQTRFSCGVSVFCGRSRNAALICGNFKNIFNVQTNMKCSMYCLPGGVTASSCEIWNKMRRPKAAPETTPSGSGTSGLLHSTSARWSLLSGMTSPSLVASFVHANYGQIPDDNAGTKEIITSSARWRLLDGEAGFDKGVFTVVTGHAEVRSYCTGETIHLAGPNGITLPKCPVDISGRWQGNFTRRLPLETGPPVAVSLELRNESGGIKGELKTPDGTFNIVSARQNDTNFQLEADATVSGQQRKIILNGKLTKGDIVFDGSESGIDAKPLKLLGAVRRLYIADSGLLPAVLNQPYSFTLTTVSPDAEAITFRLADGRLPRGISFDAATGSFSGAPAEAGNFNIRVAVTDASGSSFEQPLTLPVRKLVVTNRLLPDAFVGQPYSSVLKVAGGQPPYRFSGFAPKGLTLNQNTGELSGIPTSSRHEPSQLTIRDSQNNTEVVDVSLAVRTTTILNSHFLPEATQGTPYRTQFKGVGNNIATQWLMSGEADVNLINSLGLTLNRLTGELSGTPTRPGSFLLSVGAVTTSTDQQYRNFTLAIKPR